MAQRVSKRKNVVVRGGKRLRLPDVPNLEIEQTCWDAGLERVVGLDEVGRGSLAGPVSVGACLFEVGDRIYKIRDSKLLDARRRVELAEVIRRRSLAWAVGHASEREIDKLGIVGGLCLAGKRALAQIGEFDIALLDGKFDYMGDSKRIRPVVHGDALSMTIAAASILAKVERDSIMEEYGAIYPDYGFELHKGYSSRKHLEALRELGPAPIHRRTFTPVANSIGRPVTEVRMEAQGQMSLQC